MPQMQLNHLLGSYYPDAFQFSANRCVNLYPHTPRGSKGKTQGVLYSTPGKNLFAVANPDLGGGCRGKHTTAKGRTFMVYGNGLFEIDQSGTFTKLGTLETFSGYVTIASNQLVVNVLDGTEGYFLTLSSNAFEIISDPQFPKTCRTVIYDDTYFIWCADGTDFFYISNNNAFDAADCTNGDRGRADKAADIIITAVRRGNDIIFFGTENIEFWYNSGNPAFPYERNRTATIQIGCGAPESVQEIAGSVFFLGGGRVGFGSVYRIDEYREREISTDDITVRNQDAAFLTDSFGAEDQHGGNKFYILTIPAFNKTIAFDIDRHKWHERGVLLPSGELGREKISHTIFFNNKQYIADISSNELHEYSRSFGTDNGKTIGRLLRLQHIFSGTDRVRIGAIMMDVQKGAGETNGTVPETNPSIRLRISKDGAATFLAYDTQEIGAKGVYRGQLKWPRIGQARDIVPEFYYAGRVPIEIFGIYAEVL
jgi:hypothetical protein